jgi:hypothetical protein
VVIVNDGSLKDLRAKVAEALEPVTALEAAA